MADTYKILVCDDEKEITDADVRRQAFDQELELGRAALDAVDEKKSCFHLVSFPYSVRIMMAFSRSVNMRDRRSAFVLTLSQTAATAS